MEMKDLVDAETEDATASQLLSTTDTVETITLQDARVAAVVEVVENVLVVENEQEHRVDEIKVVMGTTVTTIGESTLLQSVDKEETGAGDQEGQSKQVMVNGETSILVPDEKMDIKKHEVVEDSTRSITPHRAAQQRQHLSQEPFPIAHNIRLRIDALIRSFEAGNCDDSFVPEFLRHLILSAYESFAHLPSCATIVRVGFHEVTPGMVSWTWTKHVKKIEDQRKQPKIPGDPPVEIDTTLSEEEKDVLIKGFVLRLVFAIGMHATLRMLFADCGKPIGRNIMSIVGEIESALEPSQQSGNARWKLDRLLGQPSTAAASNTVVAARRQAPLLFVEASPEGIKEDCDLLLHASSDAVRTARALTTVGFSLHQGKVRHKTVTEFCVQASQCGAEVVALILCSHGQAGDRIMGADSNLAFTTRELVRLCRRSLGKLPLMAALDVCRGRADLPGDFDQFSWLGDPTGTLLLCSTQPGTLSKSEISGSPMLVGVAKHVRPGCNVRHAFDQVSEDMVEQHFVPPQLFDFLQSPIVLGVESRDVSVGQI